MHVPSNSSGSYVLLRSFGSRIISLLAMSTESDSNSSTVQLRLKSRLATTNLKFVEYSRLNFLEAVVKELLV